MIDMEIYKENILDHYKNPRNYGTINNPTIKIHDANPLCGDEIDIFMIEKDGVIEDFKFEGRGCSISQAAASILSEQIMKKNVDFVLSMDKQKMLEMLGIKIGPVRMKCALLAFSAMKKGIVFKGDLNEIA